MLTERNI